MEYIDFLTQYGWQTFVAFDFLVFLLVIYFVKERAENKRIEGIQTDQVSMEERTNEKHEVTDKKQPKKQSALKKTIISAGGFSTSTSTSKWANKSTSEIILSQAMIGQLKSFHTAGFLVQKLVKLVIPEEVIESLVAKALKNELEPGMRVKVRDGEVSVSSK
jgi:hypothetical protein